MENLLGLWVGAMAVHAVGNRRRTAIEAARSGACCCWRTAGARSHVRWDVRRTLAAEAVSLWWSVLRVVDGKSVHVQLVGHVRTLVRVEGVLSRE